MHILLCALVFAKCAGPASSSSTRLYNKCNLQEWLCAFFGCSSELEPWARVAGPDGGSPIRQQDMQNLMLDAPQGSGHGWHEL